MRPLNARRIGAELQVAGNVGTVLLDELCCAARELRAILGCPPIDEVAVAVVLEPWSSPGRFMADHRADSAVVGGVVGLCVKERGLQNRCREDDLAFIPGL